MRIKPLALLILPFLTSCSPMVNIYGVFVDPWIICGLFGTALAYFTVSILGRKGESVELSESALFFCSLLVLFSLILWWIFYCFF